MTTTTLTLTDFLLARIAEDEHGAHAAATRDGAEEWRWYDNDTDAELRPNGEDEFLGEQADTFKVSLRSVAEFPKETVGPLPVFALGYVEEAPSATAAFIARHDPARVLAECEAKRRIVEEVSTSPLGKWRGGEPSPWALKMLGILAAVYADHPDYRDEWRVG